jgi:hypothetical protein
MRPVQTVSGIGIGGIKEKDGGGEFNIVRVLVNVSVPMYPQYNNNFIKKDK